MLSSYLTQSAQYEAVIKPSNIYSESTFSAAKTIAVRKESAVKVIKKPNAEEVTITAIYYTEALCTEKSKIDGKEIVFVGIWTDLYGETVGYKVMV